MKELQRKSVEAGSTPTGSKKKPKALLMPSVEPSGPLGAKASGVLAQLQGLYPNPPIPLKHDSSFQLLVACMLSAQSTDVKVNQVTPELFRRWPTAAVMATAQSADIEGVIRVLGLAPTKAKNLSATSKALVELHGGEVPDSFEALESLPGIGHKTASVVMSQAFNHAAFPVDTHIHRLAQRWGLSNGHSVEQTEADLKALMPESSWRDAHLQIIYFGREHCPAVGHDPSGCPICSWAAVPPYNKMGSSPARPGQKPPSLAKSRFTPTKQPAAPPSQPEQPSQQQQRQQSPPLQAAMPDGPAASRVPRRTAKRRLLPQPPDAQPARSPKKASRQQAMALAQTGAAQGPLPGAVGQPTPAIDMFRFYKDKFQAEGHVLSRRKSSRGSASRTAQE